MQEDLGLYSNTKGDRRKWKRIVRQREDDNDQ